MAKESPFWKGIRRPEGFTPIDEAKDPDTLTPEDIIMLKEKLKDPDLDEEEREKILALLPPEAEAGDQKAA